MSRGPSTAPLFSLDKHLQIAIHPIDSSRRQKRNGPFAIRVDRGDAIRNKHLDLPSDGRVHGPIVLGLGKVSGQLIAEATGHDMLQRTQVGALVCGEVEAGKDTLAVLKNVDV